MPIKESKGNVEISAPPGNKVVIDNAIIGGRTPKEGTFTTATVTLLNVGTISGATFNAGMISSGSMATGLSFAGTYSGNAIDFSSVTYVPTGSSGPAMIRCGTYDAPLTHAVEAQSGLIRLYMETSADGTSYDRAIFACLKTTGQKGIIPIAGLAEVHEDATGPSNVKGAEFIAQLFDTGSNLKSTAIMHGVWCKVTAIDGATIANTVTVAPIWVDNQLYGANASGAIEYGIYATTGGSVPRGVIGLHTTSSGWSSLVYFDSTVTTSVAPLSTKKPATTTSNGDASFILSLDGTLYYCPIYTVDHTA